MKRRKSIKFSGGVTVSSLFQSIAARINKNIKEEKPDSVDTVEEESCPIEIIIKEKEYLARGRNSY